MTHKIIVSEITTSPEGAPVLEREVYRQEIPDLDLKKFARDLNKPTRLKRGRPVGTAGKKE